MYLCIYTHTYLEYLSKSFIWPFSQWHHLKPPGIISYKTLKISSSIFASPISDLFVYLIFFPNVSLRVWSFSLSPYHPLSLPAFGWYSLKFTVLFFFQICPSRNSELFPQNAMPPASTILLASLLAMSFLVTFMPSFESHGTSLSASASSLSFPGCLGHFQSTLTAFSRLQVTFSCSVTSSSLMSARHLDCGNLWTEGYTVL